jgi:hypothetical protein
MKKLLINTSLFLLGVVTLATGCKKSTFDENYYNPEAAVKANLPSLYSGLFYNERVLPRYWNLYTFQIPMMGTYSQTSGYTNTNKVYEQAVNYTQDRWNAYYTGTMSQYREIEKYYNNLTSDADKNGYKLFLETSRIFFYDQTAQMVDMWGDIPFTEAGQLNASGALVSPKYDKGADIYAFILQDLKRISDYLATSTVDQFYQGQLTKYDYVNGGSITKWRKYANSLRLRLAMRTSFVNEAASKTIIQEILSNATTYPVIETVAENVQIKVTGNLVTTGNDIREGFGVNPFAPGKMVDEIMVPSGDVRLPVLFTANKNGEYHGVPNTWNGSRVQDSVRNNYFSRWDSTTFTENKMFPGIIMTAAEVSFIKAEAFERWGGGDAEAAYKDGIKKSIQYFHDINALSNFGTPTPRPTDAQINAFLANPLVAYTGTQQQKLEKIATQKWIDLGIMQANQAWAEWRRTKLPVLNFPTDPSSTLSPNVPTRLLYPSTERILNATNYAAVKGDDVVSKKVFWDVK